MRLHASNTILNSFLITQILSPGLSIEDGDHRLLGKLFACTCGGTEKFEVYKATTTDISLYFFKHML